MKLMIGEFVTGPPFQVWFDVQCPIDLKVRSFYESIPPDKKKLNSKTKMWSFNFEIYDQFVGSLLSTEYRSAIQVVEIPRFLLNGIRKFLSSEVAPQEISLLPGMMDTILPFQLEAVEFVVRRGGRALIADEMGCGKTIEAIAVLQQYRQHLPALILCPPSLTSQWKEELTKYCDELLEPKDICSLTTSTNRIYGKACIMPYSLLDRYVNTFSEERRFGIVIADESHNLKSKDAKRTCLALPLLKNAKVALCLTGTPAVNRPVELYTQLHGLLPEVFRDYEGFTNRYCDPKKPKFGPKMDVSGSSNEAELKNILEGMVMIRRLKSEVISNLPTKSREVRRVRPDPEYLPQLKALQDEMKGNKAAIYSASKSSDNNEFLNNQSRLMLTKLCGITGMSKISKVVMELELLIEEAREARKIEEHDEDIVLPERPKVEMIDVEPNIQNPLALGLIESDILSEISDPRVVDLTSERDLCSSVIHQDLETLPDALQEGLVDSDDEDIPLGLTRKRKCDSVAATCDNEDEDIFFCRRALGVKPKKKSKSGNKGEIADRNDFEEEQGGDWRDILDFSHANVKVGKAKRKKKEKQESVIATPVKPLGKKILVFAHHHDVLDAIESCARRKGVGYIRVDGTVTGSARSSLISRFQTDPEIDVAILSITACGTGLNLTCANVALFAELHWSVGYMLQAEDRIHRSH
jgi:SNF2 family DNA or RNA helicase